jgi:hypothetical protein
MFGFAGAIPSANTFPVTGENFVTSPGPDLPAVLLPHIFRIFFNDDIRVKTTI